MPGLGRSPGKRHGNPLQYSCLENPMDRGAWQSTIHEIAGLDTTERLTLIHTMNLYVTWQNEIKNLMTLKWGNYPGLSG